MHRQELNLFKHKEYLLIGALDILVVKIVDSQSSKQCLQNFVVFNFSMKALALVRLKGVQILQKLDQLKFQWD